MMKAGVLIVLSCVHCIFALPFGIFKRHAAHEEPFLDKLLRHAEGSIDAPLIGSMLSGELRQFLQTNTGFEAVAEAIRNPTAFIDTVRPAIAERFRGNDLMSFLGEGALEEMGDLLRGVAFISMVEDIISNFKSSLGDGIFLNDITPKDLEEFLPPGSMPGAAEDLSALLQGLLSSTLSPLEALVRFIESNSLTERIAQLVPRLNIVGENFPAIGVESFLRFGDLIARCSAPIFPGVSADSLHIGGRIRSSDSSGNPQIENVQPANDSNRAHVAIAERFVDDTAAHSVQPLPLTRMGHKSTKFPTMADFDPMTNVDPTIATLAGGFDGRLRGIMTRVFPGLF